mmetsp:Transcript_941/g.585  ORF Transcript_941/g.585 Transcript_941/m.585 type:complete len:91 (+) Transcript_941:16-288(+)
MFFFFFFFFESSSARSFLASSSCRRLFTCDFFASNAPGSRLSANSRLARSLPIEVEDRSTTDRIVCISLRILSSLTFAMNWMNLDQFLHA